MEAAKRVKKDLESLGLVTSVEKCQWQPVQKFEWCGFFWDLVEFRVRVTEEKKQSRGDRKKGGKVVTKVPLCCQKKIRKCKKNQGLSSLLFVVRVWTRPSITLSNIFFAFVI